MMGNLTSFLINVGLAGTICGLAWVWCRSSGRLELAKIRRLHTWRIPREENRAFLTALGVCAAALLAGGFAGNWLWGLLAIPPFPLWMRGSLRLRRHHHLKEIEGTCLPTLYALQGFLESGLNLSASLFLLGDKQPLEFTRRLAKTLDRFDKGQSLELCLKKFLQRTPSREVGQVVSVLLMGYASGLPLLPFLQSGTSLMERHRQTETRSRRVRSVAILQGALAFLLPWGLLAYLAYSQEVSFFHYFADPAFCWLSLACLIAELVGLWVLWISAQFI